MPIFTPFSYGDVIVREKVSMLGKHQILCQKSFWLFVGQMQCWCFFGIKVSFLKIYLPFSEAKKGFARRKNWNNKR